MNKNALRSIGAVLAGRLVGAVLPLGTDVVLHAARIFPAWGRPVSDALLLLATAYRTVYGVAGSYIAARLARDRPMLHALVLGALGLAASIVGAVATWNKGPAFGPIGIQSRSSCSRCRPPGLAADSARCSCAHALTAEAEARARGRRSVFFYIK